MWGGKLQLQQGKNKKQKNKKKNKTNQNRIDPPPRQFIVCRDFETIQSFLYILSAFLNVIKDNQDWNEYRVERQGEIQTPFGIEIFTVFWTRFKSTDCCLIFVLFCLDGYGLNGATVPNQLLFVSRQRWTLSRTTAFYSHLKRHWEISRWFGSVQRHFFLQEKQNTTTF